MVSNLLALALATLCFFSLVGLRNKLAQKENQNFTHFQKSWEAK